MLVKMWNNRNSHSLLVGMQNGTANLEDSLAVSYKIEYTLTIQSSNDAPWYLPKGDENLCPHKSLPMDDYTNFIHNCQDLKATICPSVGEWINKLWYIQRNILFSNMKKWAINKRWTGILNAYCLVKKANLKRLHTVWSQLYDILEKAKLWRQLTDQQLPGVREEGGMNKAEHRRCLGQWKYSVWYYNGGYTSLYYCLNP